MAKKSYEPGKIRTIALVGHRCSGKTSLGDVLLNTAGVTRVTGSVRERTSLLDFEPEERRRQMSLGLSFAWLEWEQFLLQIIDTPGSEGLSHQRRLAYAGADAAYVVISAPDGLEHGARRALAEAAEAKLPRVIVLNKMDRATDVDAVKAQLEEATGQRVVPLQVPFFNDEGEFAGVVSLLRRVVLRYHPNGSGAYSREPLPPSLIAKVDAAWEHVMESVALTSDDLLEHYLEYLELPTEEVQQGMVEAVRNGLLLPMLFVSAEKGIGAHALLDFAPWAIPGLAEQRGPNYVPECGQALPNEGVFAARLLATCLDEDNTPYHVVRILSGTPPRDGWWQDAGTGRRSRVRKFYQIRGPRRTGAVNFAPGAIVATWDALDGRPGTVWTDGAPLALPVVDMPVPMAGVMLTPQGTTVEGLRRGLDVIHQLDPGILIEWDEIQGLPVVSGLDRTHVDLTVHTLRDRLGVNVGTSLPPVAYREQPAATSDVVTGSYRVLASNGDVEAFAEVTLQLEPGTVGSETCFQWDADDDSLPTRFHAAIQDGAFLGLKTGPTANYPVMSCKIVVVDGDYDIFMTTAEHFVEAARRAVQQALASSGSALLEPWSLLHISVPADAVGPILADLAAHRAHILGMDVGGAYAEVRAQLPQSEARVFAGRLQPLTAGLGTFTSEHSHYEGLPASLVSAAIQEARRLDAVDTESRGAVRPFSRSPDSVRAKA